MPTIATVLAGTDFSSPSNGALRLAAEIARGHEARLVIAHVVEGAPPGPYLARGDVEAALRSAVEKARGRLERLAHPLSRSGLAVDAVVLTGKPFVELIRAARGRRAGLIVVGTRALRGLKRVLLGSTAERLARKSPIPLLVAKGVGRKFALRRVFVGIDFSECSGRALDLAFELGRPFGAETIVAHAVDFGTLLESGTRAPGMHRRIRKEAVAHLDDFVQPRLRDDAGGSGERGTPELVALPVPAAKTIPAYAESKKASILALGSVGRSGVQAVLVGNTAERILREASMPVLIVKPEGFAYPV